MAGRVSVRPDAAEAALLTGLLGTVKRCSADLSCRRASTLLGKASFLQGGIPLSSEKDLSEEGHPVFTLDLLGDKPKGPELLFLK